MFSKIRNAVLALAAVAALGTATLVTSTYSADAKGFGGGGGFSRGGGNMGGMRSIGGGRNFGGGRVHLGRNIGIGIRGGKGQFHVRHHHRPHLCNWGRHRCGIHVRWHRPWIYGVGAVAATSYAVAPTVAAAPRCTCLTKEYTQDGLVVFQDVCTKEVASAPIGNTQAQLPLPQQQAPAQQ